MEISKHIEIDMGHRVTNHGGQCRNCHGHRYRIELFATGPIVESGSSEGMIADFSVLKSLLMEVVHQQFDHAFCVWVKDRLVNVLMADLHAAVAYGLYASDVFQVRQVEGIEGFGKLVVFSHTPTAENLAALWLMMCSVKLTKWKIIAHRDGDLSLDNVVLSRIKVWETPSSMVEVNACELKTLKLVGGLE